MAADADCHLLLGLLVLQNGLIGQAKLAAAFHSWTQDKSRPLAYHLEALGHLHADGRAGRVDEGEDDVLGERSPGRAKACESGVNRYHVEPVGAGVALLRR